MDWDCISVLIKSSWYLELIIRCMSYFTIIRNKLLSTLFI